MRRTPPELEGGENAKKAFAQGDEGGQQHHRVWSEVVRLELIEVEEGAEESARRQAEAAQEMRAEDYPLAFLRRRRDLLLRRETDPHLVLAGQPPRLAEELDVVHMDEGAVPVPAVLHGGEKLTRKSAAAEKARPCGGKAAGQIEDWWDGATARGCCDGK